MLDHISRSAALPFILAMSSTFHKGSSFSISAPQVRVMGMRSLCLFPILRPRCFARPGTLRTRIHMADKNTDVEASCKKLRKICACDNALPVSCHTLFVYCDDCVGLFACVGKQPTCARTNGLQMWLLCSSS
jgi:hypothetical protein